MRLIPMQFKPEGDYIEVVGIFDLHYGSKTFLPDKAEQHRAYILDSPDRYVIEGGDNHENALRSSPGRSIFDQTCSPSEQRDWVCDYYEPMADRVLAWVASNHSDRTRREADIDPDEMMMRALRIPRDRHVQWHGVLSLTVGDSARGQNYTVYVRHKYTNSAKQATIIRRMFEKSRSVQGCDVYWGGHCHQFIDETLIAERPDPRHGKVQAIEQHFCMSDSFMGHEGSYAEEMDFPIPTPGQVALKLYRDEHRVEVKRLVW